MKSRKWAISVYIPGNPAFPHPMKNEKNVPEKMLKLRYIKYYTVVFWY
jgi:hypothetical protein